MPVYIPWFPPLDKTPAVIEVIMITSIREIARAWYFHPNPLHRSNQDELEFSFDSIDSAYLKKYHFVLGVFTYIVSDWFQIQVVLCKNKIVGTQILKLALVKKIIGKNIS